MPVHWMVVMAMLLSLGPDLAPAAQMPATGGDVAIDFIPVKLVTQLQKDGANVTFVDVRSRQEYLIRHIKGALSMPIETVDAHAQELPREGLVVFYCACPHELASLAYKKLHALGYRNLKVLDEGINGWVEQGFPTEGWRVSDDEPLFGHGKSYPALPLLRSY